MAVYRHRGGMRGPDTRTSALATRLYFPEKRLAGDPLWRELGAGAIVAKRMYTRYPQVDLLALTTWQMLYAAVVMSVVAGSSATGGRLAARRFLGPRLQRNPCNGAGLSLWLFVLRNLPASIAGLSTLAVPVCGVLFSGGYYMKIQKGGRLWHCVDSTGVGDDQYQETRGIACSGLQRCIKNTRLSPGVLLWFIPIPAGSADHTGRPPAARRRPSESTPPGIL